MERVYVLAAALERVEGDQEQADGFDTLAREAHLASIKLMTWLMDDAHEEMREKAIADLRDDTKCGDKTCPCENAGLKVSVDANGSEVVDV